MPRGMSGGKVTNGAKPTGGGTRFPKANYSLTGQSSPKSNTSQLGALKINKSMPR